MNTTHQHTMAMALVLTATLTTLASVVLRDTMGKDAALQIASGVAEKDADSDGIPDLFDLCPHEANVGLPDRDGDGSKDRCDLAPDGDGRMHVVFEGRVWRM